MRRGTRALTIAAGLALGVAAGAAVGVAQIIGPTPVVFGEWIESVASGSGTAAACNTAQTCIAAKGGGETALPAIGILPPSSDGQNQNGSAQPDIVAQGPLGRYHFSASLTIDSGNTTPNGFGGTCSAAGGTVTLTPKGFFVIPLTPAHSFKSHLVLDVQGTECAVGTSSTEQVLSGTYVVDSSSTGLFVDAAGTGRINLSLNSTTMPIALDMSFSGSLRYCGGGPICLVAQ